MKEDLTERFLTFTLTVAGWYFCLLFWVMLIFLFGALVAKALL